MRISFIFTFTIIAIGCGGNNGKPEISATKDNVCDQIAQVACYDMYQCCSEGQIETFLRVTDPRTQDECTSDLTRLCEQKIGIVDASLTANRVTFDSAKMNACLTALVAPDNTCATVGAMLPWAAACMDSAWTGTVAAGGMCSYGFECANAGAAYCAPNQVCTALPTDGMACSQAGCATGFYCGGGTCHAEVGPGGMCNANQQCTKGNYCNNAQPRVCAALQGPGQACTGNQSCTSNQCLPGTCGTGGNTCFTNADCGGRCSNNNQTCQTDQNCGAGTCSIGGATCNTPQQCTGAGNTCVFPNTCNLVSCVGDVVCADTQVSADYCSGAVASLPTPP